MKVQTHSGVAMVGKLFRRMIGTTDIDLDSYLRHSIHFLFLKVKLAINSLSVGQMSAFECSVDILKG